MTPIDIKFEPQIHLGAPSLEVMLVQADIANPATPDALWREIVDTGSELRGRLEIGDINSLPAIRATRLAYKAFGKDPNRYRPSAEALTRRVVKGMELYRTLAAIDLINLLSLITGHSIGGFDRDRIEGDTLTLGVGREGEPYEAIGRGPLNIAGLPVYRDAVGGVGTPTSDNERTKLSADTRRLVMTVNQYAPTMAAAELEQLVRRLLTDYASATAITVSHHRPD